jgi:hypothetical protein
MRRFGTLDVSQPETLGNSNRNIFFGHTLQRKELCLAHQLIPESTTFKVRSCDIQIRLEGVVGVFVEIRKTNWDTFHLSLSKSYSRSFGRSDCVICNASSWKSELAYHILAGPNMCFPFCKINNNTFWLNDIIPDQKATIQIIYNVKLPSNFCETFS